MSMTGLRRRPSSSNVRWRLLLVATLLAPALGAVGADPSEAASARGSSSTKYSMIATRTKGNTSTVCVGDDVPIRVRVTRALFVGNQADQPEDIPGARVQAALSDPSVGKLNPVDVYTGWNPNDPGAILFNVRALKVGATTVSFKGTIKQLWWGAKLGLRVVLRRDYVEATVDIRVDDCDYKVTAFSHFSAQGVVVVGSMEGGLKRGADGSLAGTATMTWSPAIAAAGNCSSTISIQPSEVDLTGDVTDEVLTVDLAYLPAVLTNVGGCPAGVNAQAQVSPSAVAVSTSALGGGARQPQNLDEPTFYSMQGYAVVVVTRTAKQ